jgi:SAM-dependent methyltransferase
MAGANEAYEGQLRGDRGAYERYLAGMDASMQQKVALTAAHILCQGTIADMGMGSGTGSHALAALYPGLAVVGVDVSEQMVALARERWRLPNLRFELGDIATPVFPPASLDAILDSSVLHHVTSFGGYDRGAAVRALAVQAEALRPHGVLVVRDFLDPGDSPCVLELPTDDGDDSDAPKTCSSGKLFERFAREFKSLADHPGCEFERVEGPANRFCVRAPLRVAVEFVLRKDYRADWDTEIKEEYTYATQVELERAFAALGLRVLASVPIRNPWIVRHRFRGRFVLRDEGGRELDDPATNYVIVGEKVPPGVGVRFVERMLDSAPSFLALDRHRDRTTGRVYDLVARPHLTLDALPWFEDDGDVFVLARMSYPRPILAASADPALDGSTSPQYVTEPITVVQDDAPIAQCIEDALHERAGIAPEAIRAFALGPAFFPSPGGIREEVRTVCVEIAPSFVPRAGLASGFSESGRIAAIEARQLLRAAQVGGLADARLELGVHALLRSRGAAPGPWIGEALQLRDAGPPARTSTAAQLHARPHRRAFARVTPDPQGFLALRKGAFDELDADGRVLGTRELEYVLPRTVGTNTIAIALLRRAADRVWIGLVDDDRPAAQCITGMSEILVTPAWRVPRTIAGLRASRAWVRARTETEHGLELGECYELGGRFHPSSGTTPELVFPLALEVLGEREAATALVWIELRELIAADALQRDGHTRVLAWRAAHALGLL